MRVLLLGAGGMLGRDLRDGAPADVDLVAMTRAELDVADAAAVARRLDGLRPRWVINAAAYTAVDRAESEPELAMRVNGEAVRGLAAACAERGIALVHYSTDYVFDGAASRPYREDDPTAPLGAYGRSKLAGETGVRDARGEHLLIRTQWLFGEHGRSFPRTMWERATRCQATRVVNDQWGRPTYTPALGVATWRLVAGHVRGTVHVTGGGEPATWYDVARAVFERAGAPESLTACGSSEYPAAAARPAYGVLDTGRLERETGVTLPAWRDSLGDFLDALDRA